MRRSFFTVLFAVLVATAGAQTAGPIAELEAEAQAGSAEAQNELGLRYARGDGVPQSDSEAARWIRQAADQRHAGAAYNMALLYGMGRGVPMDEAESTQWMRRAAEGGVAEAQFQIGQLYNRGTLFTRDNREAHRWMAKAADQDHPLAQEFLAIMYRDGIDVAKDASKALDLYRKSAASGSASAQFALAEMCLRGEGAEADYLQAYVFASLAAAQDFPKADKLRSKAAQKLSPDEIAEAEALLAQATASPR